MRAAGDDRDLRPAAMQARGEVAADGAGAVDADFHELMPRFRSLGMGACLHGGVNPG